MRIGARACPFCASTVATARRPACTAWNLANAKHCTSCGRPMQSSYQSLGARGAQCPRCQGQLIACKYADFEADECKACGGLFVEQWMLDRMVEARDTSTNLRLALPKREYVPERTVRYLPCPQCGKTMNRQAFARISGVIVDICRDHGVWFDPGELAQVLSFVEQGGLAKARNREAQELKDLQARLRTEQMQLKMQGAMTVPMEARDTLHWSPALMMLRWFADLWLRR